ncbi:hypothetical protein D3C78_415020 [compost metagenome]
MTSTTIAAAIRYATRTAGPAVTMALLEPTNRPAPITPPIEIIVTCLPFKPVPSLLFVLP